MSHQTHPLNSSVKEVTVWFNGCDWEIASSALTTVVSLFRYETQIDTEVTCSNHQTWYEWKHRRLQRQTSAKYMIDEYKYIMSGSAKYVSIQKRCNLGRPWAADRPGPSSRRSSQRGPRSGRHSRRPPLGPHWLLPPPSCRGSARDRWPPGQQVREDNTGFSQMSSTSTKPEDRVNKRKLSQKL